jgi:LysR family transcriptional regulator, glycine cleavage system transcriptional activator
MQVPMRAICVFHAAAKAGSVSKAAAELNVTPSAVTQQFSSWRCS